MQVSRKLMRWYMPAVFATVIFATTVLQGSTVASAFVNLDKLLHVVLYGGMGALVSMALHKPGRPVSWRAALVAVIISSAYGALEEYHQSMVPGRMCSGEDELANLAGAVLGAGWYLVAAHRWPWISQVLGR